MQRVNVELNVTMRCNLRCKLCNRMCDRYPTRTEDMTLHQIQGFIDQADRAKSAGRVAVKKVKLVGGEPLLHPQIVAIYNMLEEAIERGVIQGVKVGTNGTLPPPKGMEKPHPSVRWLSKRTPKKFHAPFWSPRDMGIATTGPCSMPFRCGFSLDYHGYLPCSAAIQLVRMAHREPLYRDELPDGVWAMEELCPVCVFSLPAAELAKVSTHIIGKGVVAEALEPSPFWQRLIERWDGKVNREPWEPRT